MRRPALLARGLQVRERASRQCVSGGREESTSVLAAVCRPRVHVRSRRAENSFKILNWFWNRLVCCCYCRAIEWLEFRAVQEISGKLNVFPFRIFTWIDFSNSVLQVNIDHSRFSRICNSKAFSIANEYNFFCSHIGCFVPVKFWKITIAETAISSVNVNSIGLYTTDVIFDCLWKKMLRQTAQVK